MKLNIKLFEGQELAGNPTVFNSMKGDFEEGASKLNTIFGTNADIMATLKNFAGSSTLSEDLRPLVDAVSNITEESSNYISSANRWSVDTVSVWDSIAGTTGAESFNAQIDPRVLENITDSYNNGFIGVRSGAEVDEFFSRLQNEVITPAGTTLDQMASDVSGASGATPDEVQSALGATIERNNAAIRDSVNKANTLIGERAVEFKDALRAWVDSSAAGARGGN